MRAFFFSPSCERLGAARECERKRERERECDASLALCLTSSKTLFKVAGLGWCRNVLTKASSVAIRLAIFLKSYPACIPLISVSSKPPLLGVGGGGWGGGGVVVERGEVKKKVKRRLK